MENKEKFLFVNPPTPEEGIVVIRDLDRSGRKSREKTIWPQANLAYLAAVMRDDFDVEIIDCIAEQIYWDEFEKILTEKKPKYILTNIISSTLTNDMRVTDLGKKIGAITIGVGSHVTALPEESMKNFPALDYIILGEAEETLEELIDALENQKDLTPIRGLVWRRPSASSGQALSTSDSTVGSASDDWGNNSQIVINEKRPLIKDLDSLPIPLHDLLPIKRYKLPFIGSDYTFVMTDRGCPYGCTFCRSPIAWNRMFRSRSAKSILEELRYLKKLGIKNFAIHSDVFTLNKERDIELCKAMIDEGFEMRWICNSRADTVDEELLTWMKKAGCFMIAYGFESGSQKVLDLSKKGITIDQIKKVAAITHQVGIRVWGYFMIGLPGETPATVRETIDLAKSLPLTLANFAVAAPYPGTEFYNLAKGEGWLQSDDWEEYDQNYSAIVSYPEMGREEIEKAMKTAYKEWALRPMIILNIFREMKNFDDFKTLFDVGWSHLKWMFSKHLSFHTCPERNRRA